MNVEKGPMSNGFQNESWMVLGAVTVLLTPAMASSETPSAREILLKMEETISSLKDQTMDQTSGSSGRKSRNL